MPTYWNPNNFYPTSYGASMGYSGLPMQSVQQAPMMAGGGTGAPIQPSCAMCWVPDEMEARGKSMPAGVTQFAMWDSNKPVIYLKSLNAMGIPNPMQVLHYSIEEAKQNLPAGQSGDAPPQVQMPDMSQFVTKQDFEELRKELRQSQQMQHMSGEMNPGNAGDQSSVGRTTNSYGVNRGGAA